MDRIAALQAFVGVAEQGSFSASARLLGRSKATVSKQVAELEAALGAQLLVRTTRRVRLTEVGAACLERCRALLDDLAALESVVRDSDAALDGVLRIAGPVTFAELYLAPALQGLMRQHPALSVDLTLTDGYVDLVGDRFDLAVRVGQLQDSTLVARRIAVSSVVCCAAPRYLAARGTPRTPAQLAGHALVVDTNFRQPSSWQFVVDGHRRTVRAQGRIRVNSAVVARDLAIAGAGIARLPAFVARAALEAGSLVQLPLTCAEHELGVHVVYPQRRHLARRVRAAVDFLAEWFAPGLEQAGSGV